MKIDDHISGCRFIPEAQQGGCLFIEARHAEFAQIVNWRDDQRLVIEFEFKEHDRGIMIEVGF